MGTAKLTPSRRVRVALILLYSILLVGVVLWPEPVDAGLHDEIARWIWRLNAAGVDQITYADIESISNVLLFVPFGVLVALLIAPRKEWIAIVIGVAASTGAETLQWLLLPDRFATVSDVIANGIGAALGAFSVAVLRVAAGRRARRAASDRAD
ncbi:VanZ family protein [Rathayibacter festucae]|uniref:VanZ family protein n=1 Tax=Rathayibacter festucae TaxID=110937 RepID=UPI0013E35A99|nr:VanZ family protein [Rathayibacter festucae]